MENFTANPLTASNFGLYNLKTFTDPVGLDRNANMYINLAHQPPRAPSRWAAAAASTSRCTSSCWTAYRTERPGNIRGVAAGQMYAATPLVMSGSSKAHICQNTGIAGPRRM